MTGCSVVGCLKPMLARGLCSAHYGRWRKHGDPTIVTMASHGEPSAWLAKHANQRGSECLIWPFKSRYRNGYGSLYFRGRLTGAHRAMCTLAHGDPPSNHEAAHSCGVRLCVNPAHLRWATRSENDADKHNHGTATIGERNPGAKLTEDAVREIRASRNESSGALARRFGVSPRAIRFVLANETWGHVA